MTLSDIAIDRPVLTWMLVIALATFGVLGYLRTGVDQFPEMEMPTLSVFAELDGATPEGMEEDVMEGTPDEDAATAAASADFTVAVAAMAGMTALGVDLMTLNGELGLLGVAVTSTPPHPPPHARPPA